MTIFLIHFSGNMAARQQTKVHKYRLFYFPLDETVAQCATSKIIDGKGRIRLGNMVRIKWDRNNPNVPAKILKLAGKSSDSKPFLQSLTQMIVILILFFTTF